MAESKPPFKKQKKAHVGSTCTTIVVSSDDHEASVNANYIYLHQHLLETSTTLPKVLNALVVEYFLVPLPIMHEVKISYPNYDRPIVHMSFSRYIPWNLQTFVENLCEQPQTNFSEFSDEPIELLRFLVSADDVSTPKESFIQKYLDAMKETLEGDFPEEYTTPSSYLQVLLGEEFVNTFTTEQLSSFDNIVHAIRNAFKKANLHLPIKKKHLIGHGGPQFEYM